MFPRRRERKIRIKKSIHTRVCNKMSAFIRKSAEQTSEIFERKMWKFVYILFGERERRKRGNEEEMEENWHTSVCWTPLSKSMITKNIKSELCTTTAKEREREKWVVKLNFLGSFRRYEYFHALFLFCHANVVVDYPIHMTVPFGILFIHKHRSFSFI